eukprot:7382036-Prymnesium_polylepis.3
MGNGRPPALFFFSAPQAAVDHSPADRWGGTHLCPGTQTLLLSGPSAGAHSVSNLHPRVRARGHVRRKTGRRARGHERTHACVTSRRVWRRAHRDTTRRRAPPRPRSHRRSARGAGRGVRHVRPDQ